jgi:DNA-3-methyladenine glycosylase I
MSAHKRCAWVSNDPLYIDYHDKEWGVPVYDDRRLFEFLILEGAQAGLSWITVLKKRAHYKKVFFNFDAEKIVTLTSTQIEKLLQDPGIIRNKLKVNATVQNAKQYLRLQEKSSFSDYIWQFVDGKPIQNHFDALTDIPTSTALSDKMSKQLKKDGFKFIGSTICYAYMQAVGMVNDHTTDCFRYNEMI